MAGNPRGGSSVMVGEEDATISAYSINHGVGLASEVASLKARFVIKDGDQADD